MALETTSYVGGLVATNPTATDPKSQGDDHLRLLKSVLLATFAGFPGMVIVTGAEAQGATASDYTVTVTPAPAAYTASMLVVFKATHANTGAATVQVGALGAKPLLAVDGSALKAGDIESGGLVAAFYDGVSFWLMTGNDRADRNGDIYSGTHDFTSAAPKVPTKSVGDNSTNAASTAYVDAGLEEESATRAAADAALQSSKADLESPALTGTPSAPTAAPNTNTQQLATCAFVVQMAFQAALPAQTGNLGKVLKTDGVNAFWAAVDLKRSVRTSNSVISSTDASTLIDITSGTFTQTFAACTTLGNGWWCYLCNSGTGDITLDPNASELIDGLAGYVMYPGEVRLVQCDGSELRSVVLSSFFNTFAVSGTFVKPPGYKAFSGLLWGAGGSGGLGGGYNGGGGGGACVEFTLQSSLFGTTNSVVIGAGGAASTGNGNAGGNSSIGSLVTSYGGGGGRGVTSGYGGGGGGSLGAGIGSQGGQPSHGGLSGSITGQFGGAYGAVSSNSIPAGTSMYGGAGGGACSASYPSYPGGNSVYGGGGGGCGNATTAGISVYGGSGGAGGAASSGSAGAAPGGGGGGTNSGALSGAGARGELRIWGVI